MASQISYDFANEDRSIAFYPGTFSHLTVARVDVYTAIDVRYPSGEAQVDGVEAQFEQKRLTYRRLTKRG